MFKLLYDYKSAFLLREEVRPDSGGGNGEGENREGEEGNGEGEVVDFYKTFKSKEDFENFLFVSNKKFAQSQINKKTGEYATRLEGEILDITGIEKLEGENYKDYNKRVLSELASKKPKEEGEGEGESVANQVQLLTQKNIELSKIHKKELEELKKDYRKKESFLSIKSAISGFDIDSEMDSEIVEIVKKNAIENASKYKQVEVNNSTLLEVEKDKFLEDDKGQIFTLETYLKSQLKPILASEEQKGVNKSGTTGKSVPNALNLDAGTPKTIDELSVNLRNSANEKQISTSTKEYQETLRFEAKQRGLM